MFANMLLLLHMKSLYYFSGHNQFKSFKFSDVRIKTKSHQQSALLVSKDPPRMYLHGSAA